VIGSENDSSWTETASGWTWELTMHSGHESISFVIDEWNGSKWLWLTHTLLAKDRRGGNGVNGLTQVVHSHEGTVTFSKNCPRSYWSGSKKASPDWRPRVGGSC
jgi:hypothetical protein